VQVISTVVIFQAFVEVTQAIQFQAGHVHQVAQVSPLSPFGIPKLNTAALLVHELLTVAQHQASNVVVVHTLTVAAAHVAHVSHFKQVLASVSVTTHQLVSVKSILFQLKAAAQMLGHVGHVQPVSPLSHFKQTFAQLKVTTFPSSSVKSISSPFRSALTIAGQVCHVSHLSPLGIVKHNTAALVVQQLVTQADVQAAQVVVPQTLTVAAVHVSHFSHFRLEY
jgi:hypothetical protein